MFDASVSSSVKGAALVEDHVFPSIAAYKAYIRDLRSHKVDFYILSFGPGARARIAFPMITIPMIETDARLNVDPVELAAAGDRMGVQHRG